jgi:hypothetical protein
MYKALALLIIACSNLIFASEERSSVIQDLICNQIITEAPEAVLFATNDKIYLKPDRIHITSHGIWVDHIPINGLFSDSQGCWLAKPSVEYWMCVTKGCVNYQRVFRSSNGICPLCMISGERV